MATEQPPQQPATQQNTVITAQRARNAGALKQLVQLRELRLARRYSLRLLSQATGIPRPTLSLIENGHRVASLTDLARLETALDLDPGTLEIRALVVSEEVEP